MDFVLESIRTDWESFLRFAPRLFYAAVLLAIFLVAAFLIRHSLSRVLDRSGLLKTNKLFLLRLVGWFIVVLGALLALGVLGFHGIAASLLATGGVAAIVLGFAFREIGENFLAGIFLTFSRPFDLGDLIKTGDLTGVIRSIELRHVHIRTFDACDVYVPSAQIFREPLYNYTRDGLRRPNFIVRVAYHDDPAAVIALLEQATRAIADVLSEPAPYVTVREFADQYIEYEVFFWLDVDKSERGFIGTRNDVKISCWQALRAAGMTFSTDVATGIDLKTVPAIQLNHERP